MKSMKKTGYILIGVLIGGVLLNGNTISAAAGLMAERSNQPVFVDGKRTELETYIIAGESYVKLRDIGKAVGFNVYWDGSVQVESGAPYTGEAPAGAVAPTGADKAADTHVVQLPTDGSKYVPQVGDLIPCPDGTLYEIKDVSRWENNCFAPGPLPDLPEPTCDWSRFPTPKLPRVDVRHFSDASGDDLFVRNLYETLRMVYTLYNVLGEEPAAWRDGKLLSKISLTIPAEDEPYTGYFWPWRSVEIEKHARNLPNGRFKVEAFDYFHNGTFLETRYFICTA